ncbi:hypothetical protein K504DRAFT_477342 [Pleomassaria siparia CBS 279.74]|uniref:AAA protein C-terminal winged helix domain-containing protein n=1 Tax=Pleomassaria siparia CBS 279.74 TaxID=1314801 RepID=A0A6G1K8Y9_9PLEO|nr:hypothetical protein K504DRAFT_477342 [Pleomassaria siparia CBS 279.74]
MFMLPLRLVSRTTVARAYVTFQHQAPLPYTIRGHLHRAGRVEAFRPQFAFCRALTGQSGPPTPGNDAPNPVDDATEGAGREESGKGKWKNTAFKMFEAAATTGASIFILALVGFSYTRYYKYMVLQKIENAFQPGDPVLELAASGKEVPQEDRDETLLDNIYGVNGPDYDRWIPRVEQDKIDKIVSGEDKGRYHLIIGEKGTGKSSMLIDAMAKIDGEGVAMCEAHADPEIFRIRLGRCLDFEFHEDNIGSLFSIRGPRDASALLDIERAFNKLEKVALIRRQTIGRPLILIINQVHLIRNDENGRDLIELIQQRAEQWAASNLATVIINSDKYWVYERLKQHATRMEVTQVTDLPKNRAMQALRNYRMKYWAEHTPEPILEEVYDKVGGRLTFLNRVAKSRNMIAMCDNICEMEKTWFLNNCGILGMEMDDDVMDQQKYASTAMVLANALYKRSLEMEGDTYHPEIGHVLPEFPLHEARYIMTRADFIRKHHDLSIFAINSRAMVRADSVPMQRAFNEICSDPKFEKFLDATLERIADIESLGRTKELTFKDLWDGGKYKITTKDRKGNVEKEVEMETVKGEKRDEDEDDDDD